MKASKVISALFGVIGLFAATAAVLLGFQNKDTGPVLLRQPNAAYAQVVHMLDAVCDGNMKQAQSLLRGTPDLGADRKPADAVSQLLWDSYLDSMEYTINGDCYATESGVALDVTISALDLESVTVTLRDRSQAMLEERVATAENATDVYDENNDYREDFVLNVLYDSAKDALREDAKTVSKDITVSMVYDNGQWWIMPESGLLDAISAGMLK